MSLDFDELEAFDREHRAAFGWSGDNRAAPPDYDGPPTPPLEVYAGAGEFERGPVEPISWHQERSAGYILPEAAHRAAEMKSALLTLDSIHPVLERNYLVKGWLDRGAASVVYGPSNVGKTFFAIDLSLHVAAGMDWHGHRVRTEGGAGEPVVYVVAEGGDRVLNRFAAFRREFPAVNANAARGGFRLLRLSINFCGSADAEILIKVLNDLDVRPALIVVDTLARSMGDGDENSAQDMGRFIANIDRVRAETGAHVMAIHHSGKDAARGARGSSSLRAAVDTEIALSQQGLVTTAEAVKQRDMPRAGAFAFKVRPVEIGVDKDGDKVTSCVVDPTDPLPKKPKLSPQQEIALQALSDALAREGQLLASDLYPPNRRCVSIECWRRWCKEHHLAGDRSKDAFNTAFSRAKTGLQEKGVIRIVRRLRLELLRVNLTELTNHPSVTVSKIDPRRPYSLTTTLRVVRYVRPDHRCVPGSLSAGGSEIRAPAPCAPASSQVEVRHRQPGLGHLTISRPRGGPS